MKSIFLLFFLSILSLDIRSECVHEEYLMGESILNAVENGERLYISLDGYKFQAISKIKLDTKTLYLTQRLGDSSSQKTLNQKFLEYYRVSHLEKYLLRMRAQFESNGYEVKTIGKSLQGRNLYRISPNKLDPNKKIITMFGRHHGDEGSANWIIEGFVSAFFGSADFQEKYQLVLYPMINPDGAEAKSRYNSNGIDLNRSWFKDPKKSIDEIKFINSDLQQFLKVKEQIKYIFDMHGSFNEDFIYRVSRSFNGSQFYITQQNTIDLIAKFDRWQNGRFKTSNGHKNMARSLLCRDYKLNALTHETIKNIPLNNRLNRSVISLKKQGENLLRSLNH